MGKLVEFVRLERKAAGKTTMMLMHYWPLQGKGSDKQGEPWKKGNLKFNLDENTQSVLSQAKAGDVLDVTITQDPKSQYWNLVEAEKADAMDAVGTTTTPAKSQAKGSSYNVGVKVGQARNQAVQVLCARLEKGLITEVTSEDIKRVAFELILDIEAMEKAIEADANPASNNISNQDSTPPFIADGDDDVGF